MKIYHIVIAMLTTLALLFILTPIFRRKENKTTEIERNYFELLKNLKKSVKNSDELDEQTKEKLFDCAKHIYGNENVEQMVNRDLKNF